MSLSLELVAIGSLEDGRVRARLSGWCEEPLKNQTSVMVNT